MNTCLHAFMWRHNAASHDVLCWLIKQRQRHFGDNRRSSVIHTYIQNPKYKTTNYVFNIIQNFEIREVTRKNAAAGGRRQECVKMLSEAMTRYY